MKPLDSEFMCLVWSTIVVVVVVFLLVLVLYK